MKKRYWLEEPHVPLHLLKAFEEKRIARKSNTVKSGKLCESSRVTKEPLKEKGFSYLFSRAERLDNHQCGHCKKDVLIRYNTVFFYSYILLKQENLSPRK